MEPRPEEIPDVRLAIEGVRSILTLLEDLQKAGVISEELFRAQERLIEADLWLKRHGNRHRLGE